MTMNNFQELGSFLDKRRGALAAAHKPSWTVVRDGDALVLVPVAEVSYLAQQDSGADVDAVLALMRQHGTLHVVVDFCEASYCGSMLLGALLRLDKNVARQDGRMALCNVSQSLARVFSATGLSKEWVMHPSRGTALAAVGGKR